MYNSLFVESTLFATILFYRKNLLLTCLLQNINYRLLWHAHFLKKSKFHCLIFYSRYDMKTENINCLPNYLLDETKKYRQFWSQCGRIFLPIYFSIKYKYMYLTLFTIISFKQKRYTIGVQINVSNEIWLHVRFFFSFFKKVQIISLFTVTVDSFH